MSGGRSKSSSPAAAALVDEGVEVVEEEAMKLERFSSGPNSSSTISDCFGAILRFCSGLGGEWSLVLGTGSLPRLQSQRPDRQDKRVAGNGPMFCRRGLAAECASRKGEATAESEESGEAGSSCQRQARRVRRETG
nr:hypothetical protein Iba_chr04bCG14520 [Ipomoea batatas]